MYKRYALQVKLSSISGKAKNNPTSSIKINTRISALFCVSDKRSGQGSTSTLFPAQIVQVASLFTNQPYTK